MTHGRMIDPSPIRTSFPIETLFKIFHCTLIGRFLSSKLWLKVQTLTFGQKETSSQIFNHHFPSKIQFIFTKTLSHRVIPPGE
jgi:hypothetical protein